MKLGVAGAGMIVCQGLLEFVHEIKEIEVIALCARPHSKEKLERLHREYGIPYIFTDYQKMLECEDIDTVYVAVNNHLHYTFAKQAILAGKHVICEKPFTVNEEECKELINLAEQHHVILLEAITNQYDPNYLYIQKNLKQVGKVHMVSCNYSQYSSRYDAFLRGEILPAFDPDMAGGALMDLNVYNVHFCVGLFGMPEKISYTANMDRGIDTSGVLTLTYEDFIAVCIAAKDSEGVSQAIIEGENGYIGINGSTSQCPGVIYHYRNTKENGKIDLHPCAEVHRMKYEFVEFERIIREQDMETVKQRQQESLQVMKLIAQARIKAGLSE